MLTSGIRRLGIRRPLIQPMHITPSGPQPATPTLSDVMTKLSQIQTNQSKIMNDIEGVNFNMTVFFQFLFMALQQAAPSPQASTAYSDAWNGATGLTVSF